MIIDLRIKMKSWEGVIKMHCYVDALNVIQYYNKEYKQVLPLVVA